MKLKIRIEEVLIGGLLGAGVGLSVASPLILLAGPLPGLLPGSMAGESLWIFSLHTLMLGVAASCACAGAWIAARQDDEDHVRGMRYFKKAAVAATALQAIERRRFSDAQRAGKARGIAIGGVEFSRWTETRHLLAIGLQGTGKTVTLTSILDQAAARGDRRMIFDPKKDFVQTHYDPAHVALMGPWDQRSVVWDAAGDFSKPGLVKEFCKKLFDVATSGPNKHWAGGAARILAGLIIAEMVEAQAAKRSATWTWASIGERLRRDNPLDLLLRAAQGDSGLRTSFPSVFTAPDPRQARLQRDEASVLGTLADGTEIIALLAAVDAAKPEALRFSLRRWLKREAHADIDTVIFDFDEDYEEAGHLIFGSMLSVVTSTTNSALPNKSADDADGMWFIVDEAPVLGAAGLVKLQRLAAVGRSRGMRVVIAAQDETQFAAVLGLEKAAPILALNGARIYSQTSGPGADSICKRIGERQIRLLENTATGGAVQGKTSRETPRPVIVQSDITELEVTRSGPEIIVHIAGTLGRVVQPFGTKHAAIAEQIVPCPAWEWGEHHGADRHAPQLEHDEPTPFDDPSPEPDIESPFDDHDPAPDPDAGLDWTRE